MQKYSSVQLRFFTNDDNKAEQDHIIDIKKNGSEYMWSFRDERRERTAVQFFENKWDVYSALQRTFEMLKWDADPYTNVQIFVPGYPTVLLNMSDVQKAFVALWNLINNVFENWPLNMSIADFKAIDMDDVDSDDDDMDEDADEDEDEDMEEDGQVTDDDTESYSSMPPLIGWTDLVRQIAKEKNTNAVNAMHIARDRFDKEQQALTASTLCGMKTPERPRCCRECPGAPGRKPRNEIVDSPALNTRSKNTAPSVGAEADVPVARRVTATKNGPRVHLKF